MGDLLCCDGLRNPGCEQNVVEHDGDIKDISSRASPFDDCDYYKTFLDHADEEANIGQNMTTQDRPDDGLAVSHQDIANRDSAQILAASNDVDSLLGLGQEVSQYILHICSELEIARKLNKELTDINEELLEENETSKPETGTRPRKRGTLQFSGGDQELAACLTLVASDWAAHQARRSESV